MKKYLCDPLHIWQGTKISLTMKLTTLFLIVSLFQVQANSYGQNTKLTLDFNDASVYQIFNEIETVSEFRFLYESDQIDLQRKTSLKVNKGNIYNILELLFENTNIDYKINGRQVILTPKKAQKVILEKNIQKKEFDDLAGVLQHIVSGTVHDELGQPLPGASIVEKGTTNGTQTDFDGNFSIQLGNESAILMVSYIGFATREVLVNGQSNISIVLEESAAGLDEVVLVGYGTQTKATLTGSITTLDSKKLAETPATNLSNAIAGQLPGVIVNTRSGAPGDDDATILIRGKGTLGNTQPLIVIDGIADRGGFSRLNPEDIESYSVLKDASAAIYGARAANGVILITTKRGNTGKPQFSFNTSTGWSQPTRLPNLLDSWQYATVENEYTDNFSGAPHKWSDEDIQKFRDGSNRLTHPNTDWLDYIIKDWTMQTNNSMTVKGGSDVVKYFVSGQSLNQKGGFENGNFPYKQVQLRANLDIQLTKSFLLGLDLANRKENRNAPAAGSYGSIMHTASATYPYLLPYYPNGLPGKGFQPSDPNLAESTSSRGGYNKRVDNIYNTKVNFSWNLPWDGLILSGYGAYDTHFYHRKQFKNIWNEYVYNETEDEYDLVPNGNIRSLGINKDDWNTSTYHLQLDYKKSFGEHNLDAFVAYEQSEFKGNYLYAYREGFPSDKLQGLFAGDVNKALTNNSSETAFGRMNYFGRINYDFAGKYLASFTLRYDGSQNFPKGNRFGAFPGISVGWRLSEEPFLKDNEIVDNLKLRASVGKMGNDAVDPYQYLASYEYADYDSYGWGVQTGYAFGEDVRYVPGFMESTVPNPNITWEKATTMNVGFDASLFKSKLNVVIDMFHSIRKDILVARNKSVPDYAGLKLPDENLGEVLNNGFEIDLTHRNRLTDDLSYNISGNFSFVRNKVKYLDEAADIPNYQKREGFPIDSYVVYDADGLFQTQEEVDNYPHLNGTGPGDVKLIDTNNDGEIDERDQVRKNYGITPEIMYGVNMGVSYKNFDLTVFFQGQGNAYLNIIPSLNYDQDFFNGRWQKQGDNDYPRVFRDLNSGSGPSHRTSTYWLKPADFLRLKNVYLSYNLPKEWMSQVFLSNAKIYLQASNLFSIDKIKYFDPESSSSNGLERYPIQRTIQVGLNLNF